LRNHIADRHTHVSRLSAAIAHRLVTEAEVLCAVLRVHKSTTVEKFIQEVVWRSYWKGWLELHPGVWRDFADAASAGGPLAERLHEGQSGCAAMDACARELVSTGYLHNHAACGGLHFGFTELVCHGKLGRDFFSITSSMQTLPATPSLGAGLPAFKPPVKPTSFVARIFTPTGPTRLRRVWNSWRASQP
jgi:deoxyribodipyrimidine photo-lyase